MRVVAEKYVTGGKVTISGWQAGRKQYSVYATVLWQCHSEKYSDVQAGQGETDQETITPHKSLLRKEEGVKNLIHLPY